MWLEYLPTTFFQINIKHLWIAKGRSKYLMNPMDSIGKLGSKPNDFEYKSPNGIVGNVKYQLAIE